jgi:hypothetical protein
MSGTSNPKYFVRGLTEEDFRPVPEAQFIIQVLNDHGETELCVYFSYATAGAMAVDHSTHGALLGQDNPIPPHIVELCRNRNNWPGYEMDENGDVVLPGFYPNDENMLAELRERINRRSPKNS